jgi:hypothetical protein
LIENSFAGIVLTAQSFNPSIFTETWLVGNKLLAAENFVGPRVFSPELSQFQTAEMQVLVVPPTMQLTFGLQGEKTNPNLPCQLAGRVVELLPHTPYQALGLNFEYFVAPPNGKDFESYDRALLGTGNYRLLQEFADSDARFGRYFSKQHGKARLHLDIKPVKAGPANKDLLQFSFNFHHDVSAISSLERAKEIQQLLGNWDSLRSYGARLASDGSML